MTNISLSRSLNNRLNGSRSYSNVCTFAPHTLYLSLNPGDFTAGFPFNWYLIGVLVVLLGMAVLYAAMQNRVKG